MKLKWIGLICVAVPVMTCTGCSSPYLLHNAFKYISELRAQGSITKWSIPFSTQECGFQNFVG